jgi:hypothetical protein
MQAARGARFPLGLVAGNQFAERRPSALSPSDVEADWEMATRSDVNLLLEGSPSVIEESLAALKPHLRAPVCEFRPADGGCVPQPGEGTLVLFEVSKLDAVQQAALMQWFDDCDGQLPVRIVSTSSESLYSFVGPDAFPAQLYYRLNVLLLQPSGADEHAR